MNTVFFEVQEWEKSILQQVFPEATIVSDKLTKENCASYAGAEVVSCFIYSTLNREVLENMPNLRYIATRSTGFDHIDIEYCRQKNIQVSNVPEYGSNTVAEHTFALILSLTRKIYQSVNQSKTLNFEHDKISGVDLNGKMIGIIGLGKIGSHVLRIAQGFGMKALVYSRSQRSDVGTNFSYVDLDSLITNSDIVTLHVPLTSETHHVINKTNILKFKKGSYLINTARGGLIETEAIIVGLDKGIFAGVGFDVLEEEKNLTEELDVFTSEYKSQVDLKTLVYNHILINHPKVLITPHNAFNSEEALLRISKTTIENIQGYLGGISVNVVNHEPLYISSTTAVVNTP